MKKLPKKNAASAKSGAKKSSPKTVLPKKKTVAAASASRKKASAKPALKKTAVKKTAAKKAVKPMKGTKTAPKKPVKKVKKTVKKAVKTVKRADVKISAVKKPAAKKGSVKSAVKSRAVKSIAKSPAKLTKPVKHAAKTIFTKKPVKKLFQNTVVKKIPAVKTQPNSPQIRINPFLPPEKRENSLFHVEQIEGQTVSGKIVKDVYSAEELKVFEQKLRTLRSQIRGDFNTMTGSALSQSRDETGELSAAPTHPADVGTDNFEQEQTFAFIQSRSERLEDIDDALERIKDKTYGVCERCNCKIPKARLNYLPYVTMCVKCTEMAEREEW